jgi:hypothetical protein
MSLKRSRLRSGLSNSTETTALLNKIAALVTLSKNHVVFELDKSVRFRGVDCTSIVIDPALGSANIQFQAPGDGAVRNYDTADIQMIRRLRTKKYLIILKSNANPA